MRRVVTSALGAAVLLAGAAACSSPPAGAEDPDAVAACAEYNRLVNQWSVDYGAEIAAVAQADAAGDEGREETAVQVVRELFESTSDQLREQADGTSDAELSEALTEAADGLAEIAGQIETYDDVRKAPDLMSDGQFASGGERVSDLCAE